MEKFATSLLQMISNQEDPFRIAAFALGEISRIHAFANGNGRLGRLIMNCILVEKGDRNPIAFSNKEEYYQECQAYSEGERDVGKLSAYIRHINELRVDSHQEKFFTKFDDSIDLTYRTCRMAISKSPGYRLCLAQSGSGDGIVVNQKTVEILKQHATNSIIVRFLNHFDPEYYPQQVASYAALALS